jgi:glycosyltransferase involved in cell wall biosynthesis
MKRARKEKKPSPVSQSQGDTAAILRACLSPACFWPPEQLGPQPSWLEHAPFAFWLIEALRPRILVELGTQGGYSYFVFCQAVQRLQLQTHCYAVDTWKGDEHAGFYGEEVYQQVRDRHDRLYSAFSTLIRSTFDEAQHHFSDGTIDLLHIDGRHYYEDVKRDFELWRRKLSDRAVVLFHDINVRKHNFGVFRVWEELRARHPYFEFSHGHGLGVLGIGLRLAGPIRALLATTRNEQATTDIRNAYSRLGLTISLQFSQQAHAARVGSELPRAAELKQTLEARSTELVLARNRAAELEQTLEARSTELVLARNRAAELEQALEARSTELVLARNRAAELEQALEARSTELVSARNRAAELETESAAMARQVAKLESVLTTQAIELESIKASTSWRLTAVLRTSAGRFPWLARQLRRSANLLWRTAELQPISRRRIRRRRLEFEAIVSSGLFDREWYSHTYPDVSGVDPVMHYLEHGAKEGRDPNRLFDTDWYLEQNLDVRKSALNPLVHYLQHGATEGRDPSPFFDSNWYLSRYPDVSAFGMNPLAHYLRHGAAEGRDPLPLLPDRSGRAPGSAKVALDLEHHQRVAVIVHLFYGDLWDEIASYLQNIPNEFGLYVSIPEENAAAFRAIVLHDYPDAHLIEVPNVGRDIGAFFSVLPLVQQDGYSVICKLHSKKGVVEPETWRRLMLQGLLGNAILVRTILHAFRTDPKVLLVGPRDLYVSGPALMYGNGPLVEEIAHRLYPGRKLPEEWGFFAGTMFWARSEAFTKFATALQGPIPFESDNAKNDGQYAHAMERTFGLPATIEGGTVGLTRVIATDSQASAVDFIKAPGCPSQDHPSAMLKSRAEEFRSDPPVTQRQTLRRWVPPTAVRPGVNLIGPVEFISGLGTSARGYVSSLAHAGIKLNVVPWRTGFERLRSLEIFCPSTELQTINLIHLNLDLLTKLRSLDTPPLMEVASPERFNVAIVYWELTSLLPEWVDVIHRFDEIWCASSFMARSVAAASARPVRIVRPAVEISSVTKKRRAAFGLTENRFVFFYVADAGSVLGRKNPKALVNAYVDEFEPEEGAMCLIKVHYSDPNSVELRDLLSIAAGRPDVVFMDRLLEAEDMSNLYELIDCYVSPHRSEGLGLTILEAMNAKKPVIATEYGGVTDFVNAETALPLDYRLIEVGGDHDPYPEHSVWADPLRTSLRSAMRRVFVNRDHARDTGLRGHVYVRDMFSLDRTAREIHTEIERIWSGSRLQ